ncbi:MarR family winged helix-turn-helix transcriptional regulator [Roseibium sp. SCP14]|uniref:MarR family winged helix-turn-helix transcriptional regulator n=1 Tax=Roseibium sp. SCP14 TaxID=3141375 RepID=UPI0033360751
MTSGEGMDHKELKELIGEVRKTFRLLAGMSNAMLEERGLTASLLAILEYISDNGSSTVPQMASAKSMKRQSIQAIVDKLLAMGLVETVLNPTHKRSMLIALTEKGTASIRMIFAEEMQVLGRVTTGWTGGNIEQASQTLREFRLQLTGLGTGGTDLEARP